MQDWGGRCAYFRRRKRELSNDDVIRSLWMTGFFGLDGDWRV